MSVAISITQDGTRPDTAGKYVDDDIVVGISDSIKKPAATYTPTTSDQMIAAGQYLAGAQTVKGDANTPMRHHEKIDSRRINQWHLTSFSQFFPSRFCSFRVGSE